MNNIQLVIPMSGSSRRFMEAGYTKVKPLIEVDGKPMIQHVLELFSGVDDVVFICSKEHNDLIQELAKICPHGKVVTIEPHKRGPVYAVAQAFDYIADDKEVIVSYCDYGTVWDFERFLRETRNGDFDGALACYRGFHPHMLGSDNYAFCREANNVLLEIKEKEPFTDDRMSEFASNGTYYFKSGSLIKKYFQELIDFDINLNGEYYVSLVYNLLIRDGLKSFIYEIDKMLQWGTPEDLEIYKGWSTYFKSLPQKQLELSNCTLVLPAAGRGDRFAKAGYMTPKPLLEIDGKSMIVAAVDCLPITQDRIFICLSEHIRDYSIDQVLCKYDPNIKIVPLNNVTSGQATTCALGIQFDVNMHNPILISACDNGLTYDQDKFDSLVHDESVDVIVWSFRNSQASKVNPNMYSWLDVDKDDFVRNVSCKKFPGGNPLKIHAIIGTMYFRRADYFEKAFIENYALNHTTNGEFYVDDVINTCIKFGLKVKVFEVNHYACWGTPNDYRTYNYWNEFFNFKR